mmetsp:Transcript_51662/g.60347  ORF Transcript_51662/g.60347 Transcript_51662/m.60347 type:complete len:80 (+) Transcript_51662:1221-1460(+)
MKMTAVKLILLNLVLLWVISRKILTPTQKSLSKPSSFSFIPDIYISKISIYGDPPPFTSTARTQQIMLIPGRKSRTEYT